MRKSLWIAAFFCLALGASAPKAAYAQDEGQQIAKDVFMNVGLKTWIATWQTNLGNGAGGAAYMEREGSGLAVIPSVSIKIQNFVMSGSFMSTSNMHFSRSSYIASNGGLINNDYHGTRQEGEFNLGYDLHPSRGSSLILAMGYKGIYEHFTSRTASGAKNADNKIIYNGVTFGVTGGVSIGRGFSIYGSGVGGYMLVNYDPKATYNDYGIYEASELGLAWRGKGIPLSLTAGYKFQLIELHNNSLNFGANSLYPKLVRVDVTRGATIGLNYPF